MNDADTATQTGTHDWSRYDAMTDAEVHAAMRDPDARPISDEVFARARAPCSLDSDVAPRVAVDAGGVRRAVPYPSGDMTGLGIGPDGAR